MIFITLFKTLLKLYLHKHYLQLDLNQHCLKLERHSLKLYKHMNLQGSTRTMKTCLEIGMIENITGSPCTKTKFVFVWPNPIKQSIKYELIVPSSWWLVLIFSLFLELRWKTNLSNHVCFMVEFNLKVWNTGAKEHV